MKHVFLSLLFLVTISEQAFALRCGNNLVAYGDYIEEVRAHCGDPLAIDTYSIFLEKQVAISSRNRFENRESKELIRNVNTGEIFENEQIEIVVEEWFYNFGPRKFTRRLYFENGFLVEIENLRRGFIPRR